jgi:hypothetical protein
MPRPKLAVWKLASCDGCQLTVLDCQDELLAVGGARDQSPGARPPNAPALGHNRQRAWNRQAT